MSAKLQNYSSTTGQGYIQIKQEKKGLKKLLAPTHKMFRNKNSPTYYAVLKIICASTLMSHIFTLSLIAG